MIQIELIDTMKKIPELFKFILQITVPYGNMLMDGAASMMDPMRNKVVMVTLRAQNGSVTETPLRQSVVIRKPLDIKGNISVIETHGVEEDKRVPCNYIFPKILRQYFHGR